MNIKNQPEEHELYILPPGKPKISYDLDKKLQNAVTFTIRLEDHTIANLLWAQLLLDPTVLFSGYKVIHPLTHEFVLKIETTSDSSPKKALQRAINCLLEELALVEERTKFEMPKFIADQAQPGVQDDYF